MAGHHPARGEAVVVLLRGHGAQADVGDPEGLRRVVSGHVLPGPGGGHGHRLAHRGDRGDGGGGAANVIFRKEIKAAADPVAKRAEIIDHYENLLYNPYIAASRGFVDQVIAPRETRPRLIEALEILSTKRETLPAKKHGNIPV